MSIKVSCDADCCQASIEIDASDDVEGEINNMGWSTHYDEPYEIERQFCKKHEMGDMT
jgi:hypothetical protein